MAAIILPRKDSKLQANLIWCACGQRSIPRPSGSTPSTRYTCPECCEREWQARKRRENEARELLVRVLRQRQLAWSHVR